MRLHLGARARRDLGQRIGIVRPVDQVAGVAHRRRHGAGAQPLHVQALAFGAGVAVLAMALLWLWVTWLLRPLSRREDRTRALGPGGPPLEDGWPGARGEVGELENALRGALRNEESLGLFAYDAVGVPL